MSVRRALPVFCGLALVVVFSAGEAPARQEALLAVSQGHTPTDTTTDATRFSVEENASWAARP